MEAVRARVSFTCPGFLKQSSPARNPRFGRLCCGDGSVSLNPSVRFRTSRRPPSPEPTPVVEPSRRTSAGTITHLRLRLLSQILQITVLRALGRWTFRSKVASTTLPVRSSWLRKTGRPSRRCTSTTLRRPRTYGWATFRRQTSASCRSLGSLSTPRTTLHDLPFACQNEELSPGFYEKKFENRASSPESSDCETISDFPDRGPCLRGPYPGGLYILRPCTLPLDLAPQHTLVMKSSQPDSRAWSVPSDCERHLSPSWRPVLRSAKKYCHLKYKNYKHRAIYNSTF